MFAGLTRLGLTYSRQTPVDRIHGLFKSLWPVDCGRELTRCGEYLIPDLGRYEVVFSPGVGANSDFELYFAEQGVSCFLADASVDGPVVHHPKFQFQKKFLGPTTGEHFISLDQWVNENYASGDQGLLQMDIECGEYETLLAADYRVLERFKMIVIEIHRLNMLTSEEGFALGHAFFQKLLKNFHVCHLHANNFLRPVHYKGLIFPSDIELTLVRKDICSAISPVQRLPHPLDRASSPKKSNPAFFPLFEQGVIRST